MSEHWPKQTGVNTCRPGPSDTVVIILWPHPTEGQRYIGTLPIDQYDSAVRMAERYAPFLIGPVTVLPYESEDEWLKGEFRANAAQLAILAADPEVRRVAAKLLMDVGLPHAPRS